MKGYVEKIGGIKGKVVKVFPLGEAFEHAKKRKLSSWQDLFLAHTIVGYPAGICALLDAAV